MRLFAATLEEVYTKEEEWREPIEFVKEEEEETEC
tara:strand:- start:2014 stop:2118 length:105 start_codon:yes stop_codon:yes gene_type:complete